MTLVRSLRDARSLDFRGSPTLRIDGRDIDGEGLARAGEIGLYSRSYVWKKKIYDAPPEDMVRAALAAAGSGGP